MSGKVALQWFFASHQGKAARELLCHQMACFAQFFLVDFRGKVLDHEFPCRYASYGHGALYHREYDLKAQHR